MTDEEEQPKDTIFFELCAENLQPCRIARAGGAKRIEFCADLEVDGLTPDLALTKAAIAESGLPVYMLLRPRAGDFVYTAAEFQAMRHDLMQGRASGVSGFALGVLRPDGRVDVERTRELVELAAPLDVTFHRAFDATPDLSAALEDVIATGCRRVLTSGGEADVVAGTKALAALVRQAGNRIAIAAGGGVRAENARALAERTGAHHFHGSLRHAGAAQAENLRGQPAANGGAAENVQQPALIDPAAIRRVVEELRLGVGERHAAYEQHHVSSHT